MASSIKKKFALSYLDLKVVESTSNMLILSCKRLKPAGPDEFDYTDKILALLENIKGISSINVDYTKQQIIIKYESDKLNAQKIQTYIDLIIDVVVENLDTIKKCVPTKADNLLKDLNVSLEEKVAKAPLLNS